MLIHASLFSGFMTDDQAEHAKRVVNQYLGKNGVPLYGNLLENGELHNFTSGQKPTDTHVIMGVMPAEMGSKKPLGSSVKLDEPSEESLARALADHNKELQRQITQLRGKA